MSTMETRALGEVATILRGTVPSRPTDSEDGSPFFGISEISAGGVAPLRRVDLDDGATPGAQTTATARVGPVILEPGDVAVALMGNIGQSALVAPRHAGAVLGRECALIRPGLADISGAWIYVWTQSAHFRDQVLRHTSGTTMPRLSYRALTDLTIPVASGERQRATEALLEEFDAALRKLGQVQSYLTELRTLEIELVLADMNESG